MNLSALLVVASLLTTNFLTCPSSENTGPVARPASERQIATSGTCDNEPIVSAGAVGERKASGDIIDTAVAAGDFKTLAAALQAAGLTDTLRGSGPFTVFAPTDAAFAKLPPGTVETLLRPENRDRLTAILTYHVVPGRVTAAEVVKLTGAPTVNGQRADILVEGSTVTIDKARVVKTDIEASNGVIHVIDTVIMPSDKDILATAAAAGSFTTLAQLINAAGLTSTLQSEGPFTVFAPTDAAFAKLPKETVAALLAPEGREKLKAILLYHVVPGRVYASDVVKMSSAKTVGGTPLSISQRGGKVMVNEAGVVTTDIDASNGVIHVIDAVLIPK